MKPTISNFHEIWQDDRSFAHDYKELNFLKIVQELVVYDMFVLAQAERNLSD